MSRLSRAVILVWIVALCILPGVTAGATNSCEDGAQPSGALYRVCVPEAWNGDLVLFAHGYVAPNEPLQILDELPDGTSISELVTALGFAFATTSYRKNGLAVQEGLADLVELVSSLSSPEEREGPGYVYLVGGSEGGLITTLGLEQYPEVFDGGLAACGPVGDFRRQINYWGDFRVIFDYFFPGVIPGSPIQIPQEVMDNWESVYVPQIGGAILANPHATRQLLRVTRAPIDRYDPATVEDTILGLLWYNAFATNDAIEELGGQSFDNSRRLYLGSDNDFRLNRRVQRFRADTSALLEIDAYYQTSGELTIPLVTMHTTKDPIVPYWHEPLYRWKSLWSGSGLQHINIPAFRYGHCNFRTGELLAGFALLVLRVAGHELVGVGRVLQDPDSLTDFLRLMGEYGAAR